MLGRYLINDTGFQLIQFFAYAWLLGCILIPPFTWYDVLIIEGSLVVIIWSAKNRQRLQKECFGIFAQTYPKVPKLE